MKCTPSYAWPYKSRWLLLTIIASVFALLTQSCQQDHPQEQVAVKKSIPKQLTALPYETISLASLDGFKTRGTNWQIVGSVTSNFQTKHHASVEEGSGVLFNNQTDDQKAHIFTAFEHGDIELDIEFMMPAKSNSGIYFQSRYEVQLFDSWKKEQPETKDCAAIYERWDKSKPEGERGYEGHPPRLNAAKAPGLWQHLHIKFRAPRFDEKGNKIQNAVFEEVIHNGVKVQENVEVTGPTRAAAFSDSEVPLAPLMIQGDHGPVAFRNIKFKQYEDRALVISDLKYDYFELDKDQKGFPELSSLPVVASGATEIMDVNKLAQRANRVAFNFHGNLKVDITGDYLFMLEAHNGARLLIDNEVVIPKSGQKRVIKKLKAGMHDIQVEYYNLKWKKSLLLEYEGPRQQRTLLAGVYPENFQKKPAPLKVDPANGEPELIRSFVSYKGKKRTHAISVGDPGRIHYSYDLNTASLLKVWRGGFADMSQAWVGRGQTQLLLPQEMSVEPDENVLVSKKGQLNRQESSSLSYLGHAIDDNGRPVFRYTLEETAFEDAFQPAPDGTGLLRVLTNKSTNSLFIKLTEGKPVKKIDPAHFVVDGTYYLKMEAGARPVLEEAEGNEVLYLKIPAGKQVKYTIIW